MVLNDWLNDSFKVFTFMSSQQWGTKQIWTRHAFNKGILHVHDIASHTGMPVTLWSIQRAISLYIHDLISSITLPGHYAYPFHMSYQQLPSSSFMLTMSNQHSPQLKPDRYFMPVVLKALSVKTCESSRALWRSCSLLTFHLSSFDSSLEFAKAMPCRQSYGRTTPFPTRTYMPCKSGPNLHSLEC